MCSAVRSRNCDLVSVARSLLIDLERHDDLDALVGLAAGVEFSQIASSAPPVQRSGSNQALQLLDSTKER